MQNIQKQVTSHSEQSIDVAVYTSRSDYCFGRKKVPMKAVHSEICGSFRVAGTLFLEREPAVNLCGPTL